MVALTMILVHSYVLTERLERGSHLTGASTFLINWSCDGDGNSMVFHQSLCNWRSGCGWSLITALDSWSTVLPLCTELTTMS